MKVLTLQSNKVLDILKDGKTYIASYDNIFEKEYEEQYKNLSRILGFNNCPIFAVPKSNLDALDSSGLSEDDKSILVLEVPKNELRITEYYDWSDYLYYYKNEEDPNEELVDMLEKDLASKKTLSSVYTPQIVIDKIKPEWLVDFKMINEALLSREFLDSVLTEKELDAVSIINKWSERFRGTYEHSVYAGGQIIVYLKKDSKFMEEVKPYVSEEDYQGLINIVNKHGNDEFEIYITLKDAKNILTKAGVIEEGREIMNKVINKRISIVEALDEEELKDSIENGIGLNLLDREEKDKDGEPLFKSDEEYEMYVDLFIVNNAQDEEEKAEDPEFYEMTNDYVSCIWDLFNHFMINKGHGDDVIDTFKDKEELTGNQVEVAISVYDGYVANRDGSKEISESLIIESVIKKPKVSDSEKEVLEMLKSHGYNYLVRNSKGMLLAYEEEPTKSKGEDWHTYMSMPHKLNQQYMFKFIKPNNRKPCKIDNLLKSDDLQVDTMKESVKDYDTLQLEEVLEEYGFEMESIYNDVATFTNEEADYDIIVFLDTKEFLDDMVDTAIKYDLVEIGYTIKGRPVIEMTQASSVGTKVDYPQKKNSRKRRGRK